MPSMAIQSKGVLISMPSLFTEDTYEQAIIELFENMGYDHFYAPDLDRDYSSPLPMSFSLGGKKVPYFTSYNFKEQALRNF